MDLLDFNKYDYKKADQKAEKAEKRGRVLFKHIENLESRSGLLRCALAVQGHEARVEKSILGRGVIEAGVWLRYGVNELVRPLLHSFIADLGMFVVISIMLMKEEEDTIFDRRTIENEILISLVLMPIMQTVLTIKHMREVYAEYFPWKVDVGDYLSRSEESLKAEIEEIEGKLAGKYGQKEVHDVLGRIAGSRRLLHCLAFIYDTVMSYAFWLILVLIDALFEFVYGDYGLLALRDMADAYIFEDCVEWTLGLGILGSIAWRYLKLDRVSERYMGGENGEAGWYEYRVQIGAKEYVARGQERKFGRDDWRMVLNFETKGARQNVALARGLIYKKAEDERRAKQAELVELCMKQGLTQEEQQELARAQYKSREQMQAILEVERARAEARKVRMSPGDIAARRAGAEAAIRNLNGGSGGVRRRGGGAQSDGFMEVVGPVAEVAAEVRAGVLGGDEADAVIGKLEGEHAQVYKKLMRLEDKAVSFNELMGLAQALAGLCGNEEAGAKLLRKMQKRKRSREHLPHNKPFTSRLSKRTLEHLVTYFIGSGFVGSDVSDFGGSGIANDHLGKLKRA